MRIMRSDLAARLVRISLVLTAFLTALTLTVAKSDTVYATEYQYGATEDAPNASGQVTGDRPEEETGGFNLQIAFSTGALAGKRAAEG